MNIEPNKTIREKGQNNWISLGYRNQRLNTKEFMRWYEERHASAFLSLASPYVIAYCRNYVIEPILGDTDFDVLSEFSYIDQAAFETASDLILSDRSGKLSTDPAWFDRSGLVCQAEKSDIKCLPINYENEPHQGYLVLLKTKTGINNKEFISEATSLCRSISEDIGINRISINNIKKFKQPAAFDAAISIYSKNNLSYFLNHEVNTKTFHIDSIIKTEIYSHIL